MWQVQVGKPKPSGWTVGNGGNVIIPDWTKDRIGQPIVKFFGSTEAVEYDTRKEARAHAKRLSEANYYWNFRVREV